MCFVYSCSSGKISYKHLFFDKQNIYVFGVDVPNISVKHFNYLFFPEKHQLNIYVLIYHLLI
ncbi:unnamed protein product [Meloidogyne enterolobii]|uniref:Uncharacterized protein n=1 Tax=Meloidogyne enterolobii TaxID=390850 RepID=A0ACB0ZFJ2_MELEN